MKKLNAALAIIATMISFATVVEVARIRRAFHGALKVPVPTVLSDASRPAAGP